MRLRHGEQGMRFVRRPERSSDDEGLIPLINVIFLILIFFMIVGHMEASAPFRVDPPVSRTDTRPLSEKLTLLLAADGRIAAGDDIYSPHTLEPYLQRWIRATAAASSEAQLPAVSVKADSRVPSRDLRSLLITLRRTGFRNVMLLTDRAR